MPSHCDCACTTHIYKIRDLKLTDDEYQRIVDTLGEVDLEEKIKYRDELEGEINDVKRRIRKLGGKK